MPRYVLAVKRRSRASGVSTDLVADFPGMTIVGTPTKYIVSVEADVQALDAFRKEYGGDFEVEAAVSRQIPPMPRPKVAASTH